MILAKPPPPKESSKEEWWAGKFLGLPEPEPGEWYLTDMRIWLLLTMIAGTLVSDWALNGSLLRR